MASLKYSAVRNNEMHPSFAANGGRMGESRILQQTLVPDTHLTGILTRQKVGQFTCANVIFCLDYAILNKMAMPTLERSMFSYSKFCLEPKVEPRDPERHNQGHD